MVDAREYSLLRRYGITGEQYDCLLEKQGGCCAICNKTPDENGQALAVDHDHKTNEIRGLLCRYCNHRVVGRHTDGRILRLVADYVERHTGWFVPKRRRKRAASATKTPRKAKTVGKAKTARTKHTPA